MDLRPYQSDICARFENEVARGSRKIPDGCADPRRQVPLVQR
jgi:hypothetical protein